MRVTIQLPDDISAALEEQWDDVPRRSLEAIAVEAYRTGALTDSQVRRLLGFESRFQVHALLKEHQVPLQYTAADLEEICVRNESSEFCPADDRRGRQRAAAYLILLEHTNFSHASTVTSWCRSLSPVSFPPLARQPSCESGSRSLRPGSMCDPCRPTPCQ